MYRLSSAQYRQRGHLSRSFAIGVVVASVGVLAACGSGSDSSGAEAPSGGDAPADTSSTPSPDSGSDDSGGDDPVVNDPVVDDDPIANAPVLTPLSTFAVENIDQVSSVAMSPDGTKVAIVTQPALGEPITITLHDSASGEVVASTQAEAIGISIMQWMADNRLVAYADREAEPVWRSWDGATLEELPSVPMDYSCYTGRADRNTGVVYASDGIVSMGDDLCRVDTADGSIIRTGEGALVDPSRFWLVPGSGGVVVLHYPDPNGPSELVTLDGTSLTATSSVEIAEGDNVQAVGVTTWVAPFDGPDRLDPGGFSVPPRLSPEVSDAGTVFISSNGMDDFVFVSALDGSVIGTIPAGMNPGFASDWSLDDSSFVRLTLEGQAEIYQF